MLFLEIAMLNGYSGIQTRPGRAEQDFWTLALDQCLDLQLDFIEMKDFLKEIV